MNMRSDIAHILIKDLDDHITSGQKWDGGKAADAIIAALPDMMPDKDVAFLSWWNETHDFEFLEGSGMYERHAKKCFDSGYAKAVDALTKKNT
jgi:hypothetical protein